MQELLRKGLIRQASPEKGDIENLIKIAEQDILVAEKLLDTSYDASFTHSYNAILQVSRAYMFANGYRPREESHTVVIQFLSAVFGEEYSEMIALFDRMRRQRNKVTYEMTNIITKYQAEYALGKAKEFKKQMKDRIDAKLNKR